jgi:molybdenum cofactor synthesis domain-containing protein
LTCLVLTLSDRAAAGCYADRSGPRIQELLEAFFAAGLRQLKISRRLLSDDPEQLRLEVLAAVVRGVDVVFTSGGTGVGPRDKAPETVAVLCDRLIPGIMEHVRAKYGRQNPRARLSRSLAGVAAKTQIYTLPGSARAVEEYTPEILETLEHLLYMLHGLDVH